MLTLGPAACDMPVALTAATIERAKQEASLLDPRTRRNGDGFLHHVASVITGGWGRKRRLSWAGGFLGCIPARG